MPRALPHKPSLVALLAIWVAALIPPCVIVKVQFLEEREPSGQVWILGSIFVGFAILITYANLAYNIARPLLELVRERQPGKPHSPIPLLGSVGIVLAALLMPSSPWLGTGLLVAYALDSGGLLAIAMTITGTWTGHDKHLE